MTGRWDGIRNVLLMAAVAAAGYLIAYNMIFIPKRMVLIAYFIAFAFIPVLKRPIVGIYLVFLILPFIPFFRRLYYLAYSRPKFDPLLVVGDILLCIVLLGLFFEFKDRKGEDDDIHRYIVMISIYFVFLLVRVFLFNILPTSRSVAMFKNYGPAVLFFFAGFVFSAELSHVRRLWNITIAIAIAGSLYGIHQLFLGYTEAEKIWLSSVQFTSLFIGEGIARPFSFFSAPVAFADYMQLALIGILIAWTASRNALKHLILLPIPLLLYSVLITSVRSSWIGIMLTFFIWFVFLRIKGMKGRSTALVVFIAVFFGYQIVGDFFSSGLNIQSFIRLLTGAMPRGEYVDILITDRAGALANPLEEHSFVSRLNLWKYLFRLSGIPENALFGRGLGAMKADSLYMTYFGEFGYPGFLFIIGILAAFIYKGFRTIDSVRDADCLALAKGIVVMNMVFAIISFTGTHIHYFPGDVYFWFFNGVLVKLSTVDAALREPVHEDHADA